MGIAHDPGIIAVGTQVCPRCKGRSLPSFGAGSEVQWMSGRGRGSAQTRSRARRGAANREEDGAGAAAIATAQEGLSEEEIAARKAALELVQASELGDEVKAQVQKIFVLGRHYLFRVEVKKKKSFSDCKLPWFSSTPQFYTVPRYRGTD
eukprot:SAG11_NODE_358_length_10235_cov_5.689917_10_plen_150_part_00